jgi:hypothetical protein
MHRAHFELTRQAAESAGAKLFLHPVVGMTKPGDVDPVTRVRCYQALMHRYPPGSAMMATIPMAMRMSGPRDSLWNAILRKTFGCTHYIVGRDHAGPGPDRDGRPFYDPYEAQEILFRHEAETGITTVAFPALSYVPDIDRYVPAHEIPSGAETRAVSGSEMRALLAAPNAHTPAGRRDHALLLAMFNTGARVQEILDVRPCDLQLERPLQVRLCGKGRKERFCPLWPQTAEVLAWIAAHKPPMLHLMITGRDAPRALIEAADLVTEMREIKHPLHTQGIRAQKGIEF